MATINGLDVKREIIENKQKTVKPAERIALLSGFTRSCLSLVRRRDGKGFELCLDCQTEFVRDYVAQLMMECFKIKPKTEGDAGALTYADCDKLLRALFIVDPSDGEFTEGIPKSFESSAAYVRGVFLGCGSVSVPQADIAKTQKSGGYHLEFSFSADSFADAFAALLEKFDIAAHKAPRGERAVVYVKDSEAVSDCLALIGADKTVLRLNEAVAAFAVKRDVVRRVNCEMANMERTVNAAVGISEAIELIEKRSGLDVLDAKLRAAAVARLENPQAPLSAVADKLGISKSGLKHRFDKIIEIARSYSAEVK